MRASLRQALTFPLKLIMRNLVTILIAIFLSLPVHSKDYYKKNIVDKAHEKLTQQIIKLSNEIDEFFADTKHSDNSINKSKLKISLDTYFREGRGPYMTPEINYQLVLPKTQRKLQLFIENEDESKEDETERTKFKTAKEDDEENDVSAGLRYAIEESGIDFSFDTGVLVNVPIVVFSKFRAKKRIPFDQWVLKVNEEVKWVNDEGFTSDLDLDFDKRLSRKLILRMVNNAFWNDEDYTIKFENGPSLLQKLSKKSALSYHAHVITVNKPEFVVENYITQITYRERIYKKWLFFQVSPFINFPRERNFHRTPGLVLSFDAIVGHL